MTDIVKANEEVHENEEVNFERLFIYTVELQ